MAQWQTVTRAAMRANMLCAALLGSWMALTVAQAPYPPAPQIKKDGTALKIEDYARLPLSSLRLEGP